MGEPHDLQPNQEPHGKRGSLRLRGPPGTIRRRFDLQKRQTCVIEKDSSGGGQRHPAGLALQQLYTNFVFQIANLPTQRRLHPPAADLLDQQNLDDVAWKSKPSWYILARKDQTVHPDLQRFLAKRINAATVETDSSHAIMLSQPDVVIDVIRKAAAAVERRQSK